jgi:uncharacterized protein (UPF0261 family)
MATVVLVGTLDTKGVEYDFVKQCLQDAGVEVILIDTGILHDPLLTPDISAAQVASAGGKELTDIRFAREGSDTRAVAVQAMSDGLKNIFAQLLAQNKCDTVLGMGGSGGTNLLSGAMRTLPLGLPKLIVSTMMSGDVQPYVGSRDITMMYSVTDIAGLNRFSRLILANAAHAAAGMALMRNTSLESASMKNKRLVGITMFGITTPGVLQLREGLEKKGFETIVFHATGSGGDAMEAMIEEGHIEGVIDFTLAELCDRELGGIFPAGPNRLSAASQRNIPQVIVPGAIEVLNYHTPESIPLERRVPERGLIIHNPTVCAVRAYPEEMKHLGEIVASQLNENYTGGNVKVLLPLNGLDAYQAQGGPWSDLVGNNELFDAITQNVRKEIPVEKVPGNINEKMFCERVLSSFFELCGIHE